MPGNIYDLTIQDVSTWPVPNYTNPSVARSWLPPFAIAWAVVSTFCVVVRLLVRMQKRSGPLGSDDFTIFVAWVFSVVLTVYACMIVYTYDIGRHIWDIRPENYIPALYIAWLAQVFFSVSTFSAKISMCLFYRRLIKDISSKAWIYTLWLLLIINIASCIAVIGAYCAICQPLNAYWLAEPVTPETPDFTCINGDGLTVATGVLTVTSDFFVAAYPCIMFQYHDLGVNKKQKILLNLIFALGFFVTGAGIARTYYLRELGSTQDLSWNGYNLFATAIVECQLAIICVCAPFLRALFRKRPRKFSTQRSSVTLNDPRLDGQVSTKRHFDTTFEMVRPPDQYRSEQLLIDKNPRYENIEHGFR